MAKVMLVEDDNNLREIYEARLQAEGYTIVAAKDGEEALVVAKAEKPDLIISDVMMPRISGFEMLDILRNTDGLKEVKVIMLTALGQSDDQQRADRLGADRYLVKSQVTLEDIVKVTHELLQDAPTPEVAPAAAAPAPSPAAAAPAPVAVAVAPEPVAAPIPEPAAVPEPAAPTATPDPVATAASEPGAQTTSQEEASVEAQIEDFVAGASSDATAPQAPVEALPSSPAPEPAPESEVEVPAAPEPVTAPEPVVPTPEPVAPAPEPVAEPAPAATAAPAEDKPENDNVKIAHKKVIEPLGVPADKPDIHTLVALEEAKEAAQQGPPPPTAVVATNETGQQAAPIDPAAAPAPQATDFAASKDPAAPGAAPANGEDPNAIAL
jgi:CheY-like chemotaxis protein